MRQFAKRIIVAGIPLMLATAIACTDPVEGGTPPTISPDVFAPIPTPRPFGPTPTPVPITLPTPSPTATPYVVRVPVTSPTPTATTLAPTPTATPSPTVGAPDPEPTPDTTAVPPTPTPTPTPVPISDAPGDLLFAAEETNIILQPENLSPESLLTGTDLADFSVSVTFDNPVGGSFRPFSYGVKFRESSGIYQAISINSVGQVRYLEGTVGDEGQGDSFAVVKDFLYGGIQTSGADVNSIHLTVVGDRGWLYVNNDYLGEFVVRNAGVSGDVQFIAELENETGISGATTLLINPEVRSGEPAGVATAGTIIEESGILARTESTGLTRDFIVETEFVSPYERILGRWSAGFEFFDPVTGTTDWVFINNSQLWSHFRMDGTTGELIEVAGGTERGILRDRGDINHLQVIAQNGAQQLLINGVLIGTIDIQPTGQSVQIALFTGFADTDQQAGFPTDFLNYRVWSFGT